MFCEPPVRTRFDLFPSPPGGGARGEGAHVLAKLGSSATTLTPTLSPGEREQIRGLPTASRARSERLKFVHTLVAVVSFTVIGVVEVSANSVGVIDDRGVALAFASSPQRIVSLVPSVTESVCALGACKRLVGTDQFSNSPSEVVTLPKFGGLEDAQIERIVSLKPDVVLASKSARVVDRLESLGVKVIVLQSDSHADVKRTLTLLAKLFNAPDQADRVWANIERDIKLATSRVPHALRGKKVYFEVAADPYAAGTPSFIGETLTRLGVGNIAPPELGPFPKLNPEFIVRAKPDIIMAAERQVKAMPSRPGWSGLAALQGRSCGFATEQYEVLIRPGPRMGEAALAIADCLAGLRVQTTP
jgi:iron complex transport system substrate-binding protein